MPSQIAGVGVLPGQRLSFIDHLVPLCQIVDIPLLCTDPWIHQWAQIYYPQMNLLLDEAQDFTLDRSLKDYNAFFYVDFCRLPNGSFNFQEYRAQKKGRSVWALHGNSDKKRNLYWIERLADEDVVLLYGQHMVDFVKEKGIWNRLSKCILTGNFRLEYYLQHKNFFDKLCLIPKDHRKTILYAPTWSSDNRRSSWRCDYSSFFEVQETLFQSIPSDYRMMVKIHPNLIRDACEELNELRRRYEDHDQIFFLENTPLIYPLLEQVDIYLGDYSSVGYDFLTYNRPLFFLNMSCRDDPGVHLYRCGETIEPEELAKTFQIIDRCNQKKHEAKRQETYAYAFGHEKKNLDELKAEILASLEGKQLLK